MVYLDKDKRVTSSYSVEDKASLSESLKKLGISEIAPKAEQEELKPLKKWFYPSTNEKFHKEVCDEIQKVPPLGNTVVGVSGLQNLSFFVSRPDEVHTLILIDPDPAQKWLWKIVVQTLQEAKSPQEAIQSILQKAHEAILGPEAVLEDLKKSLSREEREVIYKNLESFLLSQHSPFLLPKGFEKMQKAAKEGRIVHVPLNLADFNKMIQFGKGLAQHECTIDTFYTSNIHYPNWLGEKKTLKSIRTLVEANQSKGTIFLTAADIEGEKEDYEIRENLRKIQARSLPLCLAYTRANQLVRFPSYKKENVLVVLIHKIFIALEDDSLPRNELSNKLHQLASYLSYLKDKGFVEKNLRPEITSLIRSLYDMSIGLRVEKNLIDYTGSFPKDFYQEITPSDTKKTIVKKYLTYIEEKLKTYAFLAPQLLFSETNQNPLDLPKKASTSCCIIA